MRIIFLSDTHGHHRDLDIPEGDLIIHGGDFTDKGTTGEAIPFLYWFESLPHAYKILIPGNHDLCMNPELNLGSDLLTKAIESFTSMSDLNYILCDNSCEIEGFRFWGSPYTPKYGDKWTFALERASQAIRDHWKQISHTTDVLITHGPPYGMLDEYYWNEGKEKIGCEWLRTRIEIIRPRLHLFGHVHDSRGVSVSNNTTFINGSIKRDDSDKLNSVWTIDIDHTCIEVYEDSSLIPNSPF